MRFPLRRSVLFVMRVVYMLGLLAIFFAGWRFLYQQVRYWFYGYLLVLGSYGFILLVFTMMYGGFKVGEQRLGNLLLSCFLAIFLANAAIYFELSLIAYQMLPLWGIIVVTAGQCLYAGLCCYAMNKAYFAMSPPWEVVAVYGANSGDAATLAKMSTIHKVYRIAREVDASRPLEEILAAVEPYESVLIGSFDAEKKDAVLKACYRAGKRINLIPTPMDVIMNNAVKTQILDTPVLLCRNREMTPEQAFVKRSLDILFSLVCLVVASPLFLIVALSVRLADGGPVIFSQQRLTLGGKPFKMYKFRSMRAGPTTEGAPLASEGDPRVTGVGRVIRQFRLDELPQLWNVLRGEMSMVGPRPERPEVYAACEKTLPEFDLRLGVKAGLTGYAQIYGRYNTALRDKLNLDLFYIENYSPMQDLRLMLMTVKVLFVKESTQGVAQRENDNDAGGM